MTAQEREQASAEQASAGQASRPWWQTGVIYQIYPRSFQDSNGDGIGDLQGIVDRLDHLNDGTERSLGVDGIWLSPTFPSPMADFGYDVSDYTGVHEDFGTLETMDRLIAACHARGIRVLLDFVPNHTSDLHPWFIESRSSRDNPKRDWYIWRDPAPGGGPPNNWLAVFGGSMWTLDERTGQYYLHSFLAEQPDLNWRNPAVVQAMHDALRFWLDRGIDGFRVDVLGRVLKDPQFRDNPPNPDPGAAALFGEAWSQLHLYNNNRPEGFEVARGLRAVIDEYPERMLVGEVYGLTDVLTGFYGGEELNGLNLCFNFRFIVHDREGSRPSDWSASRYRQIVDEAEAGLPPGAWPNYVLGNHDRPRFVSRHDEGGLGQVRARVAALVLLTLRGTPFIYYGEEIGMPDVEVPDELAQDPARFRAYNRDPCRTPMQWTDGPGGGFTSGRPWLPLGDTRINAADQRGDPASLLTLYRRLLWLRKRSPALQSGSYRPLDEVPEDVFAYLREAGDERYLVVANFGSAPRRVDLPAALGSPRPVLSTAGAPRSLAGGVLELRPNEGVLLDLTKPRPEAFG